MPKLATGQAEVHRVDGAIKTLKNYNGELVYSDTTANERNKVVFLRYGDGCKYSNTCQKCPIPDKCHYGSKSSLSKLLQGAMEI